MTDDNNFTLSGSNAISWYLSNENLKKCTHGEKCQILNWLSFSESEMIPLVYNWVLPMTGIDFDLKNIREVIKRSKEETHSVLKKLNDILLLKTFLVGERISLADICIFSTLLPLYQIVLDPKQRKQYVNVNRWFNTISQQSHVRNVIGKIKLCEVEPSYVDKNLSGKSKKESGEGKQKANKQNEEKIESGDAESGIPPQEPKEKDPFANFPKSHFDLDDFKRFYSNNSEDKSIPYLWEKIDLDNYSIWFSEYKYPEELKQIFMSCNLITGMYQRLEKMRKNSFASVCLFGENNDSSISGIWIWRGRDLIFSLSPDWQVDYESYSWEKLNPNDEKTKSLVKQYLSWTGCDAKGRKFSQGKIFK